MDTTLGLFLTLLAGGIVTFLTRLSFIALHGRITLPNWFTLALTFVPVAVLSAITLPELLIRNEVLHLSLLNPRLVAGILAALVAWRTKNVWATIGLGMVVLIGLQYVLP